MTETQKDRLGHINDLIWYESGAHLILDEVAKRTLELFSTIVEGKKSGSLFHVLDETVTSLGARRLRWWLNYPLRDPVRIRERLAAVSEIREEHLLRETLRGALRNPFTIWSVSEAGSPWGLPTAGISQHSGRRSGPAAELRSLIAGVEAPS